MWGMLLYTELNTPLCTFHLLARPFPSSLSVVVGHLSDDLYRAHGVAQEMPINKVIAEEGKGYAGEMGSPGERSGEEAPL